MHAERMIIETDAEGKPRALPKLPPNCQVEAISLIQGPVSRAGKKRLPPPEIAGKGRIVGDIVSPAIQESEWGDLA